MVYRPFVDKRLRELGEQLPPNQREMLTFFLDNRTPRGTAAKGYLQKQSERYGVPPDRARYILGLGNRISGDWRRASGKLSVYGS